MPNQLTLVPIHLEGLLLEKNQLVTEANADFSRMPFATPERDYNPDTANLSEEILSPAFQNHNLNLKKGMHLHWALPDALTKGGAAGTAEDYPAVPTRWLVTRRRNGTVEKQWMVESDYLHPIGLENEYNSIAFPIDNGNGQPFRYMGRQVDYASWSEDLAADRLARLTAMGYGEPSFAAFYPNCHSVFGCFDEEVSTQADLADLSYQVVGWYSDVSKDPLKVLLDANPGLNDNNYRELISEQFAWKVSVQAGDLPVGIACFADLQFEVSGSIVNTKRTLPASIAIGNTGTEALSAYLASQLSPGQTKIFEEQLENLLLQTGLQHKDLDLGPRFFEARHEKGFKAESGGSLWEVHSAKETEHQEGAALTLPISLSDNLNTLNESQQALDKAVEALQHQKTILFADWYKYMVAAYPPDDAREEYPDIDLIQHYISTKQLPLIQRAREDVDNRVAKVAEDKAVVDAQLERFNNSTIDASVHIQKLDKSTENIKKIRVLPEERWIDNAPFSDQCLSFNGKDAVLSISMSTSIKAFSAWIKIGTQEIGSHPLLATDNGGVLIAKNQVSNFWSAISINGVAQRTDRPLSWHDIPKDQWIHLYIAFEEALPLQEGIHLFGDGQSGFSRGELASLRLFDEALTEDEIFDDHNVLNQDQHMLKEVSGPRYWQATEPVVLLEGASVEPSSRYGFDGRLRDDNNVSCPLATINNSTLQSGDAAALLPDIIAERPNANQEKLGYDKWTEQPWHPFLMDWEAEMLPLAEGGNLEVDNHQFNEDFLTDNYTLPENSPELQVKPGKSVTRGAAIFRGRSILTPHAKIQVLNNIRDHLKHLTIEDCFHILNTDSEVLTSALLTKLGQWYDLKPADDATFATFQSWYDNKFVVKDGTPPTPFRLLTPEQKALDFNYAIIRAGVALDGKHFISQALSGFRNALLMHHQTMQLPINDPIGFDDYRAFTAQVNAAIGISNNLAPLPLNEFLPIRSGSLRIIRLQVIDTFGQVKKDVSIGNPPKAEPMQLPTTSISNTLASDTWLPPRFSQPARINVRWLSAESGHQELNSHPESSPVCGWLLANHLDNSLAVYDHRGIGIGIIDQEAAWRSIPGDNISVDPLLIKNISLRKVVQRLAITTTGEDETTKRTFLQDFISTTDRALENIDPESFAHHQELALLMGRPIAVVRIGINLELKAPPAIHHGWHVFRQDLLRTTRETNDFEKVKVPIRIGERRQLNDGVLGYWKEDTAGVLNPVFHTTVDTDDLGVSNPNLKRYEDDMLNTTQSLTDPAEHFTVLLDPRADLHVTTGLLPAKAIHIPPHQYTEALKRISITFLSAPILTGKDETTIPLPNELGYDWSFLTDNGSHWEEVAKHGLVRRDKLISTFNNGAELWQQLLDKGWITAVDEQKANIVPTDQRPIDPLDAPFDQQADKVQELLDASHIIPVETHATFNHTQRIVEGWLKLSPSDNT